MPSLAERQTLPRPLLFGAAVALLAVGYGLTLWIFYHGIMTYDAKFVYEELPKPHSATGNLLSWYGCGA